MKISRAGLPAVVVGAVLAMGLVVLYEAYIPGPVSEVAGAVVSRRVSADESGVRHWAYVRLDGGETVRARHERAATMMPGDRLMLVQIETPLIGFRRYRYKQHVERSQSVAVPAERPEP